MKTINFYHNNYLSKCDLINKYDSQNLHEIPKITSITLELPISQLVNLSNKNFNLKSVLLKTYLIFYIIFGFKPYINYKAVKTVEKNYSLKFQISNLFQIQYFLHFLFIYFSSNPSLHFLLDSNIKHEAVLKTKRKKFLITNSKSEKVQSKTDFREKLNFVLKIPAFCFYRLDIYGSYFLPNLNLKELFFFLNIVFDSEKSNYAIEKLKNFSSFWSLTSKSKS